MIYIGKKKSDFDRNYTGSGVRIRNAVNKHGRDNFAVIMLGQATDTKSLNILEKYYIAYYEKLVGKEMMYNLTAGGDGGFTKSYPREHFVRMAEIRGAPWNKGKKCQYISNFRKGKPAWNKGKQMSEEQKTKLRENYTYHVNSGCFKNGQNAFNKGVPMREESKLKISQANKGRQTFLGKHHSKETKQKISIAHKNLSLKTNPIFHIKKMALVLGAN